MITAIDTSVLLAVYFGEAAAPAWMERLIEARRDGALVICPIVAAELFAAVREHSEFDSVLRDLGVAHAPISIEAACLAGQLFRKYRDQGGPREYLIPDFIIGAHASIDAHRLAANDRGYLRRYFPDLTLLTP